MPRNEWMDHPLHEEDCAVSDADTLPAKGCTCTPMPVIPAEEVTPIPEENLRGLWEKETGFTTTAKVLIEQQKRRQEESQ